MKMGPLTTLAILLLCGVRPAMAQVCEDLDADDAVFGFSCPASSDCEDRSWSRHPGAADVCDGFDNDCDRDLDTGGCDRSCDFPFLFAQNVELADEGAPPEAFTTCAALTDYGILEVTGRVYKISGQPDEVRIYSRAYDRRGRPLGPSYAVGDPSQVGPYEIRCALSYAGDRLFLSWQDAHTRDQSTYRLMARVLGPIGEPLSDLVDVSSTSPVGSAPWVYPPAAAWDGARFALFWTPYGSRWNLLVTFVDADGSSMTAGTYVVTSNIDPSGSTIQEIVGAWTGDRYLLSLWHDGTAPNANTRILTVDREGVLLTNNAFPLYGTNLELVLGRDRAAIFSSARVIPTTSIRAVFSDLSGNYLAPPGAVTLMQVSSNYSPRSLVASWSGEQFGVALSTLEAGQTSDTPRLHFFRVLPDGTNLDPGGRLVAQGGSHDTVQWLAWTGDEWSLIEARTAAERRMYLERIVCSCSDLDGDTHDACQEVDCNDRDPTVHPGALEACRGLQDEDCDGTVDCDDTDCPGGAGPQDPLDLHWEGSQLQWTAPAGSQRFDLARGLLSDVVRRGDMLESECPGVELAVAQWSDDGRKPAPGEVLWYLVRAEGTPCASQGWGDGALARDVRACH